MAKAAILYCKKIKDESCIACAKCFKGIKKKNGEFARYETVDLVAMTDCGDCPGLVVPKVKLLTEISGNIDRPFEVLFLGTCIKIAMDTAQCPIEYEDLKITLEKKFNIQVILGTHSY